MLVMTSDPRTTAATFPAGATLADLGEFGVLDVLTGRLAQGEDVLVGPGDDAAEVRLEGDRALLATDVLVDGRHFRRDWATANEIGHRVAAANLSDINAMGGRGLSKTVGVPSHTRGLNEGKFPEANADGAPKTGFPRSAGS